jgi:hypothetical protein
VPTGKAVILAWEHNPGPYSYNVYETTNPLGPPEAWMLKTNVLDLSVGLAIEPGEHFFTVSCVDTNTGIESPLATP